MLNRHTPGFSLVELLVTLTLLGTLMALAVPAYGTWIANSNVRSAAESIQNALRMAQTEAVRRNRQTVFGLTDADPSAAGLESKVNGSNWFIQTLPITADEQGDFVQGGTFSKKNGVSVSGVALICFNSMGRQVSNKSTGLGADCDPTASMTAPTAINISLPHSDRPLRIEVSLGGQIRLCDTAKDIATQPDGCRGK
jgi:type IV fimbrial biogenesis protein FimT